MVSFRILKSDRKIIVSEQWCMCIHCRDFEPACIHFKLKCSYQFHSSHRCIQFYKHIDMNSLYQHIFHRSDTFFSHNRQYLKIKKFTHCLDCLSSEPITHIVKIKTVQNKHVEPYNSNLTPTLTLILT